MPLTGKLLLFVSTDTKRSVRNNVNSFLLGLLTQSPPTPLPCPGAWPYSIPPDLLPSVPTVSW